MSGTDPRLDEQRCGNDAAAYVLGALPEGERERFERHAAGCERCREDVAALQVAVDALPVAVIPAEPPPALKARIMATVNAEAELLRAAGARADAPAPARRWRWRPRLPVAVPAPLTAALAAAALVVGGVAGFVAGGGDGDGGARVVAARVDAERAPDASARLRLAGGSAELLVSGMPDPGADRVYQVWLRRPGRAPEPTDALFAVRPGGRAAVAVPGPLEGVEAVLVTSEPRGGSTAPTRPPVITARLA